MTLEGKKDQVICQEIFTEGDEPTNEEIRQFAETLGIDIDKEPNLLALARDGLMQPLPCDWVPCIDKVRNTYYYFNTKTGKSQFEHPLDAVYKQLVKKARAEAASLSEPFDDDSRTSIKEELRSFEEVPITPPSRSTSDMLPRPRLLAPLNVNTSSLKKTQTKIVPEGPQLVKKVSFEECEVRKRPNSSDIRNRRNIGPVEFQSLSKLVSRDDGYGTEPSASSLATDGKKELTLTGGGEVFLKKSDPNKEEKQQQTPITLNRELKVQFELPSNNSDFASKNVGKTVKQVEIDFDELQLDFSVPKTNYVDSDNEKRNESSPNLIDLSDSNSSVDSQRVNNAAKWSGIAARKKFFESGVEKRTRKELSSDILSEREVNLVEVKRKEKFDAAKADKLKELEGEFNAWVKAIEKSFKDKENAYVNSLKERHEDWRKNQENEIIKRAGEQAEAALQNKLDELKQEFQMKEETALKDLESRLMKEQQIKIEAIKEEFRKREEMELNKLQISLNDTLEAKKDEILKKHGEDVRRLENGLELVLDEQRLLKEREDELRRNQETSLQVLKLELRNSYDQQRNALQKQHEQALNDLRFKNDEQLKHFEEELTKKKHSSKDIAPDPRLFEKLRCEKRLLEDKYSTLKEKYIRLKTDVKLSLGKKSHKRESTSETEKSSSQNTMGKLDFVKVKDVERKLKSRENHKTAHLYENNENEVVNCKRPSDIQQLLLKEDSSEEDDPIFESSKKKRQLFSKLKTSSTLKLDTRYKDNTDKEEGLSPVENLRRQLKKLEELEDQFPVTTHTDMYLRYPFTDAPEMQFGSSDFEFIKHRIHLERDSVKRAKEFLKTQKKCFESRQLELQRRLQAGRPKSILGQIYKEEKELAEMEVSVHRTRSLLGEKIIRLRHLEQSLQRMHPDGKNIEEFKKIGNDNAGTLSDLSSHSDSSGFSSTHQHSDHNLTETHRKHYPSGIQEPSEIIHSLEKLNTEIRGIWDVLKQQSSQQHQQPQPVTTVRTNPQHAIPKLLLFTHHVTSSGGAHLGHVTTFGDSSLADRTRSLRDWLKVSRHPNYSHLDPSTSHQVTL